MISQIDLNNGLTMTQHHYAQTTDDTTLIIHITILLNNIQHRLAWVWIAEGAPVLDANSTKVHTKNNRYTLMTKKKILMTQFFTDA